MFALAANLFAAMLISAAQSNEQVDRRPRALMAMQQAREAFVTAAIELTYTDHARGLMPARRRHRVAGADYTVEALPDSEGVLYRDLEGRPSANQDNPLLALNQEGKVFRHEAQRLEADYFSLAPDSPRFLDPRSFGAGPGNPSGSTADCTFAGRSRVAFSETIENGLHVVTCTQPQGATRFWIDPEKDWNPVRVAAYSEDGTLLTETRTTLQKFGRLWFPKRIETYYGSRDEGAALVDVIEIETAEFDRPEHPPRLSPADIGIDPGIRLQQVDDKKHLAPIGDVQFWDGERIISKREFNERITAGELRLGPRYLELVERQALCSPGSSGDKETLRRLQWSRDSGAGSPESFISVWEAYTGRFIARYALDEAQSGRAKSILQSCQEQAASYLNRRKQDITAHEKEIDEAVAVGGEQRTARLKELRTNSAALMKPIDDIFNESLKPRLEKLPTRAQREAAERPTTSAPAGAKKGK